MDSKEKSAKKGNRLKNRLHSFCHTFARDKQLYLLIFFPALYILIFRYQPMYGAQIAFRNYRPKLGITGSEWVGLKWFEKFLTNYNFKQIFENTVILSLYSIVISFSLAILIALLLNALPSERFKKFTQTVIYIPHFISVVVIISMMNMLFNPVSGAYGTIFNLLGGEGYPTDFRLMGSSFRNMYVWSGVWQNLGWDTIIYTAALSSVSTDLHEAAMIDGASRWKRVLHVDLPAIIPTACIMLILRCGSVMTVGFEKVFLMQNTINQTVSEVISTYVYKVGMGNSSDMSYAAAINLFNSVINCFILVVVNKISAKLSDNEVGLF